MIAPLRRRHRGMVSILAIAAPVVLVAGLASRPQDAVGTLPGALAAEASGPALATVALAPIDDEGPSGVATIHAEHLVVELETPLRSPSVLAYWLPAAAEHPGDGAYLLGPVSHGRSNVWPLPEAARDGGYLLLWSLGHARPVAGAMLPAVDQEAAP